MTPGARIEAAIELLDEIRGGTRPADQVIDAYFKRRRYAGSGDRRAISERVYNLLRHRARIDWWIERTGLDGEPDTRRRLIADLALSDKSSPGQTAELFSGARHCPAALTAAETELADALYGRPLTHGEMPGPVRYEYPDWMEPSLSTLWGERLETEISALNQRAAVDLRVNTLKATPEVAEAALVSEFIEAQPTPLSPIGLRLTGTPRLGGTQAFKTGLVEIQDEGSQIVALLTGAEPGMTVIDFCAGAGGKTLALASSMGIGGKMRGRLIACDVSDIRLERMQPRLKRSGARHVECRQLRAKDDPWIAENEGTASWPTCRARGPAPGAAIQTPNGATRRRTWTRSRRRNGASSPTRRIWSKPVAGWPTPPVRSYKKRTSSNWPGLSMPTRSSGSCPSTGSGPRPSAARRRRPARAFV